MTRKLTLLFVLLFVGTTAFSQRTTDAKDGDYSFLTGHSDFNIKFDYTGMTIGKNITEEDYLAREVMEKEEKEKGSGEKWREAWENAKINEYEPAFAEGFNKQLKKAGLSASVGDDAEITLIVTINRLEPGFYSYAVNRPAILDYTLTFVKTENPEEILSQVIMTKIYGSEQPAVSQRVGAACRVAGTKLGSYIKKTFK